MRKKLSGFIILALMTLFHMDVHAVSINAFTQPSESTSLVNQLFHQALNSINKFFTHSNANTQTASSVSLSKSELQAAITQFYLSSNANIANQSTNQNSADVLHLKTFFDKNETAAQEFASSDGKPSPDSERAFV